MSNTQNFENQNNKSPAIELSFFSSVRNPKVDNTQVFQWDELISLFLEKGGQSLKGRKEDAPGFSGAVYRDNKRANDRFMRTSVMIFDFDENPDWDKAKQALSGFRMFLYSTASHTEEVKKFRLVLPLSCYVETTEDFQTLWAWFDNRFFEFGNVLDKNTKDPARFWFEPCKPINHDFVASQCSGELFNPAHILEQSREQRKHKSENKLRVIYSADAPREKRERLARAYIKNVDPAVAGRGGHARTWETVCILIFGFDLDESIARKVFEEEYNPRCDPPWSEREIDHKFKQVTERGNRERGYLLKDEMLSLSPRNTKAVSKTQKKEVNKVLPRFAFTDYALSRDGGIKKNYGNVLRLMKEHEAFAGRLRYNEMTATEFFDDKPICEDLIPLAKQLVEEVLGFTPPRESITDAVTQITRANRFHPVQSYLRGLEWDGNQRLIHGAYRYLGVSEPIYADFLYYWMIGAVRRALFPGTKMDTALMLVGKQGAGKSTFFKILGKDWHSDTHIDITHKDSYSVLHESWIYEMSELENLVHGKSEARLKNFLATTHDVFRPAYARCTVRLARSVAICGTTNKPDFLTDSSGSRRFWIIPIDVDKLKLELVEQEVDQLWAEACQLEGIGLNHWFNENKEAQRETHNLQYYQVDPWEDALTQFFASRPLITEVTVCELLSDCLSIEISRQSRYEYVRVGKILAKLGWESRRIRKDSGQTRLYFKPAAGTRQQVHSLE